MPSGDRLPIRERCASGTLIGCLWLVVLFGPADPGRSASAREQEPVAPIATESPEPIVSNSASPSRTLSDPATTYLLPPSAPLPAPTTDPWANRFGPVRTRFTLDAVIQLSGVTGSWWNLSEQFAPDAQYDTDRAWVETWIKPGLDAELPVTGWLTLHSRVSYVGSGNIGTDVFVQGYRGLGSIEDLGIGGTIQLPDEETSLDISYGRRQYKIGSGMLISVGAGNGFERGATTSFARRAWKQAGIVTLTRGAFSIDGFYRRPNELQSADTLNHLAGTNVEWDLGESQVLGMAYMNVFESIYPYVAAPLRVIPDGRRGLNTIHAYGRLNPLTEIQPNWYVAAEYAHQWNDRIEMSADAFSVETGYTLAKWPFAPRIAYTFRWFGGDDPATVLFEKFDPLYYEGSPPLWATGSNGSFSFLNSNVLAHRLSLLLTITSRDLVAFYYWHVQAVQIDSPIQFGQAGRVRVTGGEPSLVAGVPTPHLSDDIYLEYTRVITQNIYLTSGVAVSVPGEGLRELVADPKTWFGGLINLTIKY